MSMLIQPFRFAAALAPTGWQAAYDTTFTENYAGYSNYTVRTFVSRVLLPAGGTKVRVTFRSAAANGLIVSKAYVGASRGFIFDVAPTQLLFSGNPNFSIPAATDIVSDELTFAYGGLTDLCVSFFVPPGSGPNDWMARRPGINNFSGSKYGSGGDQATEIGGISWGRSTSEILCVKKIEVFKGGSWNNIMLEQNSTLGGGWNTYTLRTKIDVGHFTRSRPNVRIGLYGVTTDMFIGNSAEGSTPFDFLAPPTRLLFGGANGTPTDLHRTYLTDTFDMPSILDVTKPILLSYYNTGNAIGQRTSPPPTISSRYRSGNNASVQTGWHAASSNYGDMLGPTIIDEQY